MVTDCLRFIVHSTGIEILELPIPYPLPSSSVLLDLVREAITTHGASIKVAVFSHISSMVCLPLTFRLLLCFSSITPVVLR